MKERALKTAKTHLRARLHPPTITAP